MKSVGVTSFAGKPCYQLRLMREKAESLTDFHAPGFAGTNGVFAPGAPASLGRLAWLDMLEPRPILFRRDRRIEAGGLR